MATFGYTANIDSGDGAVKLSLGSTGETDSVIIRANDDNIYIGGYQVDQNLPTTGFKLIEDRDYYLTSLAQTGAAAGSSDAYGIYVATTSGANVSYTVFFTPKV